jgi:hypothetical protein
MKKIFFLIVIVSVFLSLPILARELEIDYPTIPGTEVSLQTVEGTSLPDYVKYIFNFAIGIVALLAFGVLLLGGFRYITSAGNPAATSDARGQMLAGVLGMIILLSSYIILTTINPQLVVIEVKEVAAVGVRPTPGVWVCKKAIDGFRDFADRSSEEQGEIKQEIADSCYHVTTVEQLPGEFDDKAHYIYLIEVGEEKTVKYGVILQEDENFQGRCRVMIEDGPVPSYLDGRASAVIPFIVNDSPEGAGITLYRNTDFNAGFEGNPGEDISTEALGIGSYPDLGFRPCGSIEVDKSGQYIAIVYQAGNYQNNCEVFDASDHNLEDDYTGKFCGFFVREPCVMSMEVIGGGVIGDLPR